MFGILKNKTGNYEMIQQLISWSFNQKKKKENISSHNVTVCIQMFTVVSAVTIKD